MRKLAWFVLIAGGIVGVLYALIFTRPAYAVALAIVSIVIWSVFGATLSHFTGMRRILLRHLGPRWRQTEAQVISHAVKPNDRPNVQLALEKLRLRDAPPTPVLGYAPGQGNALTLLTGNGTPVPLQWERFPRSLADWIDCATNAVYLLRYKGDPYLVMVKRRELSVAAQTREAAQGALDEILATADEASVYRGAILSLEKAAEAKGGYSIRFHSLPTVDRSAIILPDDVMSAVERNVVGLLSHAAVLKRAGRGIRHGVLLHGPPGTGKTLVVKYLARACPGFTVILLTGRNLRFVRQSCQLARVLAPSLVVMEDVDLVAVERGRNRDTTVLHWLMDEMDGLGPKAETIFLLTTNRPEVLEPALTARPGRVDQAIYFPLPDRPARGRLFAHYADGLDVSAVDVESLLDRTDGASPAFIQELFRKAALMAAERGERSDPLKVTTADFGRALHELVEVGGDLTRTLLGFARPAAAANA